MKILISSSYLDSWNSVRPEAEIFIEMAKQGHSVTIATQGKADYVSRFVKFGIRVIDCYPKRKVCLSTIRTLHRELKLGDYDIVYAMNSRTIPNAAFASVGLPIKMVTYRGTVGGLYRRDPSAYLTHLHPRIDGIVCVAEAVRREVAGVVWRKKQKIVTIYKGHNLSWYCQGKADLSQFQIPAGAFIGICVANARPSKGVSVLIEATYQLHDLDNFHLLLVGLNIDKEPYATIIRNSPMASRIHVAGYRTDVPALMAASNIQIQPSISGEGLPKTIIEGMTQGLPSVATTTGGASEMIEDGICGFIVPTNNVDAIAQKIRYLINDPARSREMGQKAVQRMQSRFSLKQSVKAHLSFFEELSNVSIPT